VEAEPVRWPPGILYSGTRPFNPGPYSKRGKSCPPDKRYFLFTPKYFHSRKQDLSGGRVKISSANLELLELLQQRALVIIITVLYFHYAALCRLAFYALHMQPNFCLQYFVPRHIESDGKNESAMRWLGKSQFGFAALEEPKSGRRKYGNAKSRQNREAIGAQTKCDR
jgi:hypothetical protein